MSVQNPCFDAPQAMMQAMAQLRSALDSGSLTFTELPGEGAILLLTGADEMLTINASAGWLMAKVIEQPAVNVQAVDNLLLQFAQKFNLPNDQAGRDASGFLRQIAAKLI